ncbi:MAG: hypothetical protein Q4E64_00745 [Phascolarctobacterium sp.]|uniref:hypothetical protein n=1 Tax=Phascolarctobacterium sp. TaxID=2049039 RepID=UPI0026DB775C|nr:hypothetical protein [Phascolarctobacterium sp.]MDO4920347.1 hypothetical protein [Phascolarctobacterium sp.]
MEQEKQQNAAEEAKTVEVIDDRMREEEAESLCRWAAARAGVIVVAPLLGTMSLIANEIYLIIKLGKVYGEEISEQAAVSVLGSLGAYFVGSTLTTLIPFAPLQIPVAVGTTYALGRVVTEWLKAGKPKDMSAFKTVYEDALASAKKNINLFKNNPKKDEPLGDEKKHYDI